MSSFFMLKLKQAEHVQQGPCSICLLVLRHHKDNVKSKDRNNIKKFKYTIYIFK